MCLSLCACSNSKAPATAIDQLTPLEKSLFDALIIMISSDFYEPSSARVLEIGDYEARTNEDPTTSLYGTDTVVVRLQAKNRMGGTLNHYFNICITAAENKTEYAQNLITYTQSATTILKYKADVGDYVDYEYYNIEKDASDIFNISRINEALREYWENIGL